MNRRFLRLYTCLLAVILLLCFTLCGCDLNGGDDPTDDVFAPNGNGELNDGGDDSDASTDGSDKSDQPPADVGEQREAEKALGVPAFSGSPYFALNNNEPNFTLAEKTKVVAYEFYSPLDSLGRCGYAQSCVGTELMPTEERESISAVKPSGWKNKKYDTSLVDGGYIYNRCHIIGFQLTGENANKENLITGTRYMNVDGMLPFENMIADYIKETGNHVMYRVTPIYDGNDLVACGAVLEAYSVEDEGEGVCFNVYVYNVQPGIVIDYATGDSWLSGEDVEDTKPTDDAEESSGEYVMNTNTKKVHKSTCSKVDDISEANKQKYVGSLQDLIDNGYSPCGICKPAA